MVSRSSRRYNQNPNCPPGWMWLLAGLLIGMFLSFLIYLRDIDSSVPAEIKSESAPAETVQSTETKPPSLTPSFEFYDILPQSEVNPPVMAVSEVEAVDSPAVVKTTPPPTQNISTSAQILQVGAFRDVQEAEGLKAHLAMLGIRSQVRASSADGTGVWHRVEVGPVKSFAQLERLQAQLKAHNIAFIFLPTPN